MHSSSLQVYEACRGFQSVFGEARERAVKALAFAKTLRKDLEVSAEFSVTSADLLMDRLAASGHVRVLAPHTQKHQIFISGKSFSLKLQHPWFLSSILIANLK